MSDLFRFFQLRPANLVTPEEVHILKPDAFDLGRDAAEGRRNAQLFLQSAEALKLVSDLKFAQLADDVVRALTAAAAPAADIRKLVLSVSGAKVEDLVASAEFLRDEFLLRNTLVAAKICSGVGAGDTRGLARAAQGYDTIRNVAAGADEAVLRPLVITDLPRDPTQPPSNPPPTGPVPDPNEDLKRKLAGIDAAISHFRSLSATSFLTDATTLTSDRGKPAVAAKKSDAKVVRSAAQSADGPPVPSDVHTPRPWALSPSSIREIPPPVMTTLQDVGVDPQVHNLPVVLQKLGDERTQLFQQLVTYAKPTDAFPIGNAFYTDADGWVGTPATPMPTGHGTLNPVGVGDLLLVKEHILRYEGGELAHVENVLKSEHLTRDTRRLERTETTVLDETETTKEEERDNQTTDRFSLKRETSSTIKSDSEFKAGASVSAKYGPFVEVKANAEYGTHSSSEELAKQATEFSKDVVARSVSSVTERVLERRSTTTVSEFEERYSHGFDNTAGTGNISGIYQWVDKVSQAQVYNYGKRMLFDLLTPEPATMFFHARAEHEAEKEPLQKPDPFTVRADQITEYNYTTYALQYDVVGLEAPPQQFKTISKAFDGVLPDGSHSASKSQDLTIDEGYQALYALFQRDFMSYPGRSWKMIIGSNWIDAAGTTVGYVNMAGEVAAVSVAFDVYQIAQFAATVEIFCERTERAMLAWRLKTHAAILQGYLAKLQAYETALAEQAAAAEVVIAGQNPLANARTVMTELRKQALTFLTAQQFDAFGALEVSAEGFPQPNLARSAQQMPYVRFFEQAFEWEHVVYFFYPYFWGWKPAWLTRMLLDDVDPEFSDFLRAGAARVVFPVRPGFEAAVAHYLETGEIWSGGPPPDITSPLYVSIIKEIQEATGAPGNEVPVGDPWLVRMPTTLAKLRPDDKLPEWTKVGEDWQPVP